ncbi:hypothetical protein JW721_05515 [Candidatus Micrarchaeota archaeon]|nr:hypothetical protein [Candidatus Micrarchaeota archaeon]
MHHAETSMPPQRGPKKARARKAGPTRGFGKRALCAVQDSPAQPRLKSLFDRKISNPQRSREGAEALLSLHKEWLIPRAINKYKLFSMVEKSLQGEVRTIVMCSILNSAYAWKEGGVASFRTYALACAIECIGHVCRLNDPSISARTYQGLGAYFKARRRKAGYEFSQFIEDKGISGKSEALLRKALAAVSRRGREMIGANAIFDGTKKWLPEAGHLSRALRVQPGAFHSTPSRAGEIMWAKSRLGEILKEVLDERKRMAMLLHFGVENESTCDLVPDDGSGLTFEQIGGIMGVSKQRVKQMVGEASSVLSGCRYAGELREHLKLLAKCPGN